MTSTLPYDPVALATCARTIADTGRDLAALGWTPATSSNFSMRLDASHIAVTISGRDKGRLSGEDVMVVDLDGRAVATDREALGRNAAAHADLPALRRRQRGAAYALARADGRLAPVRIARRGPLRRLGAAEGDHRLHDARERARRAGVPEHAGHERARPRSRCVDRRGQAAVRLLDRRPRHLHVGKRHAGNAPPSRGVRIPASLELDLWRLRGEPT